nr:MAG TPA: hypothetical protein [Caudoviricetes sp.]
MKKNLTIKKALKRLDKATACTYKEWDGAQEVEHLIPARKTLTGKQARRMVGMCYAQLANQENGWLFFDRPRFAAGRRYYLISDTRGMLTVARVYGQRWERVGY